MKMFRVTFMLFLSFFFAFGGAEYYDFQSRGRTVDTSDNLRPCGVLHQVNSQGTKEYFLERCDLYSMPQNCSEAWELFVGVWNATANYSESHPPDYTAFIEFFDWKAYMQENKYQPIFYSGSGQCPDIVHRLTNVTGIPLITLEDQNGPYAVANAAWCNPQYFNATTGSCAQQTVWGHVPNGNQSSYNQYQGAAFWGPASAHFGKSAFGTVWALLRSFQTPTAQIPAYPNGIFRGEELPMVMKQEAVTGFRVVVVSNTIQPNETCNNPAGTVWQIQTQVKARWNDTKCIVDPPCILQFACDPAEAQLFNTTSLTNKDMKCNYFFALQEELGTAANLNCDCSTDDISMDGDNFVTSSPACPIPHKKSNDPSSPTHPWYSWPNWFIVVCSVGGGLVLVAIVAAVIIKRRKRAGYEEINTTH